MKPKLTRHAVELQIVETLHDSRYEGAIPLSEASDIKRGEYNQDAEEIIDLVLDNLAVGFEKTSREEQLPSVRLKAEARIWDALKRIREARTASYNDKEGSKTEGFQQIGRLWQVLLERHFRQPVPRIPAHVVALMMATLKVWRAITTISKFDEFDDSIVDLMNYGLIAAEVAEEDV